MNNIFHFIIDEEDGQGLVEYSLILALLILICIVGLKILGESTLKLYNESETRIP